MIITKTFNDGIMNIALEGRLDTTTAPQLEAEISEDIGNTTELNFDFAKLEYVSSAGLRVLLASQKIMNKQGKMTITNVCDDIKDVFDITGFTDILTII